MPVKLFSREEIERLLKLLAEELTRAGVKGTISLVGGAALGLYHFSDREMTADIDALLPNNEQVPKIISKIAHEENLHSDWINDAAKAYVPFENTPQWIEVFTSGTIVVRVGTVEMLLAMKLRADRGRRDRPDIEKLLKLLGLARIEAVDTLFESFYHQEVLDEKTRWAVIRILEQNHSL